MKKFSINSEVEFEMAIRRLHRWYELRAQTASDPNLDEEERAYRVEGDHTMIESYQAALRDYLVSLTLRDDLSPQSNQDKEPQLARAA